MKPTIGKTEAGKDLAIDVPKLLATRMLFDAESGGGKTVALKRLLEQTHGHVQQIVIDPEGEFSTLREKFDYLLCAPDGADAIANPKTAVILARKLRETRVSAVIDIYDLRPSEQRLFVRLFIEELLAAPKNLWNPCLVVIDEAQIFAPEQGEAESLGAIMDLRGRGRKRGLCLILATPRLAQLSKDACAGLQNKLIGVTTLDLDVKRAARDLSMSPTEATTLLRNLEPGEFYCFGPALTRAITKIKVGTIQTAHGQHVVGKDTRPPAPSEKIKDVIAKLTDLPKEADQEARTLADYKREVANLKRELTLARKEQPKQPATEIKTIEKPVVGMKAIKGILKADTNMRKNLLQMRNMKAAVELALGDYQAGLDKLLTEINKVQAAQTPQKSIPAPVKPQPIQAVTKTLSTDKFTQQTHTRGNGDTSISVGERKTLTAIAQHTEGVTREQITVLTGYKRSTRDKFIQLLRQRNAVEARGDRLFATEIGIGMLGSDFEPLPVGEELRNYWLARLNGGERKILEVLIEVYPNTVDRLTIDEKTGYRRSTRDKFIQLLRNRQLVEVSGTAVRASDRLF